jgi:cell wall-associated NlpC family hydrolase
MIFPRRRPAELVGPAARIARGVGVALLCGAGLSIAAARPAAHPVRAAHTAPSAPSAPATHATATASPPSTASVQALQPTPVASASAPFVAPPPVATALGPVPETAGNMVRFLDRRGLLDPVGTVANKSTELFSHVRDGASDLVSSAMNFLGVPYKHGGNSVDAGFDCSGFTRHVFENSVGLLLPHRADEQAKDPGLLKVDLKDLKPGDLVFFNTLRRTFSHVGIYLGEGKFIHSPRTGETVRVEDMRISYWARRFTGARRVPGLDDVSPGQAATLAASLNVGSNSASVSAGPVGTSLPMPPLLAAMTPLQEAPLRPAPATRTPAPTAALPARPALLARPAGPSAIASPLDLHAAPQHGER